MTIRIEVKGRNAASNQRILRNAKALGIHGLTACRTAKLYFLAVDAEQRIHSAESLNRLCALYWSIRLPK